MNVNGRTNDCLGLIPRMEPIPDIDIRPKILRLDRSQNIEERLILLLC